MFYSLVILTTIILSLPHVKSQEECSSAPPRKITFNDVDYLKKDTLGSFNYIGGEMESITIEVDPNFKDIFKATLGEHLLLIQPATTTNLDEIINSQPGNTIYTISITVRAQCNQQPYQIIFDLSIEDTNDHSPTFTKTDFTYTLPSPLMPRYDLTSLGEAIIAKDLDFSNENIQFTVLSSEFQIETDLANQASSKEYRAVLTAKNTVWLSSTTDLTLQIIATDTGSSPQISQPITVTLKADLDQSEPEIPVFSKNYYIYQYNSDTNSLDGDGVPITVSTKSGATLTVTIEPNDGTLVLNYDPSNNEVALTVNKPITNPTGPVLTYSLKAKKSEKEVAESVVLIEVATDSVATAPSFKQPSYNGTYRTKNGANDEVTLDEPISLSVSAENLQITTNDERFTVNEDGGIDVISDVNFEEELLGGTLTVQLVVSSPDPAAKKGYSTLLVQLPKSTLLQFSHNNYNAVYGKDGKVAFDGEAIAISKPPGTNPVVDFQTSNDNFEIVSNSGGFEINVNRELGNDILIKGSDFVLPIKLSLGVNEAVATLVIKIEKKIDSPRFSDILYQGKYEKTNEVFVVTVTSEKIVTDSESIPELTVRIINEFAANFNLTKSNDGYEVAVFNNLDENTLQKAEIIVDLEASVEGIEKTGLAKLRLTLPLKPSDIYPKFSTLIYTSAYIENKGATDTIKLDSGFIRISSEQPELTHVKIAGTDPYITNFELQQDTTDQSSWIVQVNSNLDKPTLEENQQISINLEASLDDSPHIGYAVILVDLPLNSSIVRKAPVFTETYYKSFIDTDGKLKIDGAPIQISDSGYEEGTKVVIDDPVLETKFTLARDASTKTWTISLNENLDDNSEGQIVVKLRAVLDYAANGVATLFVKLPEKTDIAKFSEPFYSCKYAEKNDALDELLCDQITIDQATSDVAISSSSPHKENFNLLKTSTTITISVTTNLPDAILTGTADLVLVLEATNSDHPAEEKNTATVVIDLPLKDSVSPPRFKKNSYTATYHHPLSGKDTVSLDDSDGITILDVVDVTKASVSIADSTGSFRLVPEGAHWTIELSKPLDEPTLKQEVSITLDLKGVVEGKSIPALATLVVKLPKLAEQLFGFERHYYNAEYEADDEFELDEAVKIQGETAGVVVMLGGELGSYFKVKQTGNEVDISLAKKLPGDLKGASVTLDIVASKDDKSVVAPLIIALAAVNGGGGKGGGNDTTYIVVIVLLAVLAVGGMVGTGFFFYRRQAKSISVEEASVTPRFTKNSTINADVKHEPAMRRPTGIFNLQSKNESEIDEEEDKKVGRRKSVVFDDTVEEMEIDPNDKEEEGSETSDESDTSSDEDGSDEEGPGQRSTEAINPRASGETSEHPSGFLY